LLTFGKFYQFLLICAKIYGFFYPLYWNDLPQI